MTIINGISIGIIAFLQHVHFLGSVHTDLLAIALALAVIAKNGTHFLASLALTLLLRAQCEWNLKVLLRMGKAKAKISSALIFVAL